jgi:hypothetical protein
MQMRRAQPATTFRSQYIVDRLKLLARSGKSRVSIVEDALAQMPIPDDIEERDDREERRKRLEAILDKVQSEGSRVLTMTEFDALEYDERGDPK